MSIFADDPDGGGYWSCWVYPEDDDAGAEEHELFVPDLVAEYLVDGQVAVFVHVGAEKQRYVTGYAVAVYSDGRQVRLDLDGIIEAAAAAFGVDAGSISLPVY